MPGGGRAGRPERSGRAPPTGACSIFGDASPDLAYCAEALTDAFPDARIVQFIRDGRDVVSCMLRDQAILSWFKPSFANLDTEFPNPFFGVETEDDRGLWPSLSLAGKFALRWRGAVRLAARLRRNLPAEQLITVRYETLLERPSDTASAISAFVGLSLPAAAHARQLRGPRPCARAPGAGPCPPTRPPTWRRSRARNCAGSATRSPVGSTASGGPKVRPAGEPGRCGPASDGAIGEGHTWATAKRSSSATVSRALCPVSGRCVGELPQRGAERSGGSGGCAPGLALRS